MCVFCEKGSNTVKLDNLSPKVQVLFDSYPSAENHILVTPVRHVARLEDLTEEEYTALFATVRALLVHSEYSKFFTEGATIGVNNGKVAGQTIPHAHVHIIPRRENDVEDPRGGVRWVLPESAAYWKN